MEEKKTVQQEASDKFGKNDWERYKRVEKEYQQTMALFLIQDYGEADARHTFESELEEREASLRQAERDLMEANARYSALYEVYRETFK